MDVRNIGLRGVTVADSKIGLVDGDKGILIYRGYQIQDLAEHATFEEVIHLLMVGCLPTPEQLTAVKTQLMAALPLPDSTLAYLRSRSRKAQPMDVIQGALTVLADEDPALGSERREDLVASSYRLIARTALVAAAWHHLREGRDLPVVTLDGSLASVFLLALWGRQPTDDERRLMDTLLVLHAEHSLNASTFAARGVASTRAHLYAAASSAVGALSGALHGGANARVMEMLLGIGSLENVEPWVTRRIDSGQRVMGLGHAVYTTEDPRADILRTVAAKALAGKAEEKWFHLALEVRREAMKQLKEKKRLELFPNVDFYSGPILYSLGLAMDMFPVLFAVSRVAGWCAHIIEELLAEAAPKAQLYRPEANYTGRLCGPMGCKFIPLESRGAGCPCGKDVDGCDEAQALAEP
jgi:citrate synthase